jgi:hypothetical protein
MTKLKGRKKAKMLFTVKRIDRKQIRHLRGAALAEATAKMEAKWGKMAAPAKA